MNILYLISADKGNGVGGHYNSLDQISREVGNGHGVRILILGASSSPVLETNPFFKEHIRVRVDVSSVMKLNETIKLLEQDFKPDLIHCFDTNALNRVLLCPVAFRCPIAWNKCGGKNPLRKNYQHADGIVVFSEENRDWFIQNKRYDPRNIFLISNRVRKLTFLPPSERVEQKTRGVTTFIRISRLGGAYDKTLLDTYNLIELLGTKIPVELIVVGRVQHEDTFNALRDEAVRRRLSVKFITDERAARGSDFLYLADFVIGTGRSFMEAISLGIPTLAPAGNASIPILIHEENFHSFLGTNFSERSVCEGAVLASNVELIEKLIADKSAYAELSRKIKYLFDENLGTDQILSRYEQFYNYLLSNPRKRASLIIKNWIYILRFLLLKK